MDVFNIYVINPSNDPSIERLENLSLYPLTHANALANASVGSVLLITSSATGRNKSTISLLTQNKLV